MINNKSITYIIITSLCLYAIPAHGADAWEKSGDLTLQINAWRLARSRCADLESLEPARSDEDLKSRINPSTKEIASGILDSYTSRPTKESATMALAISELVMKYVGEDFTPSLTPSTPSLTPSIMQIKSIGENRVQILYSDNTSVSGRLLLADGRPLSAAGGSNFLRTVRQQQTERRKRN